jgi:hypothetical protein
MTNAVDHGASSRPHEVKREAQVRHKKKARKNPERLIEIYKRHETRGEERKALKPQE